MKQKLLFALILMALAFTAKAYDFPAVAPSGQWLYYNINGDGTTVTVTRPYYGWSPTGSLIIPNSVAFSGMTYMVTSIDDNAFCLCSALTSVTIPNSVTLIGNDAFSCCSSLASVTIPNSVTSIGNRAFSHCSALTSVTIPDSVTSIGNIVFSNCTSLVSVTIGNSVTSIGEWAFYNCSSLCSLSLGKSIKTIGSDAFYNTAIDTLYYNIDSIGDFSVFSRPAWDSVRVAYIGNNVRYWPDYLLRNCRKLESIAIGDSVGSIRDYAFSCCSSLASVTIPNSVTLIGDDAFSGCSSLASVTIPNSVTSIGGGAFSSCFNLASVTIPNSVTSIGGGAFYNCSSLASVTIPNSVTSIGGWAFYNCSNLRSLSLGKSIKTIGSYAFYNTAIDTLYYNIDSIGDFAWNNRPAWDSVHVVIVCDSVRIIPDNAFPHCSSLASVTIGNSVTSIGDDAFSCCSSLASVTIPNSATSIGNGTFSDCSSLASVTIPNSVTSIGDYAFNNCSSLTSVTIPNSVTSIGNGTFSGCSSLASVTIPNSVTSIGDNAFNNCSSLASVTIPNSVTSIGDNAFNNCSSLASVTIPNSVTLIDYGAFYNCSNLRSLSLGKSIKTIGSYAFYNTAIDTLYYNIDSIGDFAWNNRPAWDSVRVAYIGNNVHYWPNYLLRDCHRLESVTIGDSINQIYSWAFFNCSSLDSVFLKPSQPPILGYGTFDFNAPNRIFILDDCKYNNYYTTNPNDSWYPYQNSLRDAAMDISFNVSTSDPSRGSVDMILQNNRYVQCDSTVIIQALANNSYYFDRWSTGSTANPDTLTLAGDSSVTAYFYKFIVKTSNYSNGSTSHTNIGDHIEKIMANANYGYHFDHWSNGRTANPDTVTITCDTTIIAYFLPNQYTLIVTVDDSTLGTATGSGVYEYNRNVSIAATCTAEHYHFDHWSDGSIDSIHTVTITGDMTITAYFSDLYQVSVYGDNFSEVSGSGRYHYGSTATVEAFPVYENALLIGWSDGAMENPYTFTVLGDTTLMAISAECYPSICMVSVHNNHNLLILDNYCSANNVSGFNYNIYREGATSGDYDLVATVPFNEGDQWLDMESRPLNRSYRYRITASDQYGNETPFSDIHKTMHLTISQGIGNSWNLVWTEYQGTEYSSYQIYRGTNQNNIELIDQMPADGNTTYSDYNVLQDTVYYQVAIVKDEPCYNAKSSRIIRSNIATNGTIGISTVSATSAVEIHPNPAMESVTLQSDAIVTKVELIDMYGRQLKSFFPYDSVALLPLNDIPSGTYILRISTANDIVLKKLIVK